LPFHAAKVNVAPLDHAVKPWTGAGAAIPDSK
jgi:hypothetical protein